MIPKLPKKVSVVVFKGKSGSLLARLPEYEVFTEADNLNDLIFQVNDLIYTYFDVPKEFQDDIQYLPSKEAQEKLIKTAQETNQKTQSFTIQSLYAPYLLEKIHHQNYGL